jgi:hypothetical protein
MRKVPPIIPLSLIPLLLMLVGAILLFEQPAYGYTDPGTGLLAIQAVGSAVVAVGWYLRRRIYSLFHWGGKKKSQPTTHGGTEEGEGLEDEGSRFT